MTRSKSIKNALTIAVTAALYACGGEQSALETSPIPDTTPTPSPITAATPTPVISPTLVMTPTPPSVVTPTPVTVATPSVQVNLALNKTTEQSSIDAGGEASRAVDGNTDGTYRNQSVTHTATEAQPWWQVDLGASSQISSINIYNRTDDCCTQRLSGFYVLVSDENFSSSDLNETLNQAEVHSHYYEPTVDGSTQIEIGVSGRFVRIQLQGSENPLSLAEVEVMGSITNTVSPTPIVTPTPTVTPTPAIAPTPVATPTPVVTPTPIVTPEPSPSPSTPDPALVELYELGAEVYAAECASCHDPLEVSKKRNRTREDIVNSLVEINQMRNINLSEDEIDALTYALNNGHPADEEPAAPVVTAGQEIFEAQCASCHSEDAAVQFPLLVNHTDLQSITSHTADTMPPASPSSCVDDCASSVAAYILTAFEPEAPAVTVDSLGTQRLKRDHYYRTVEFLISPYGLTVDSLSHPADPSVEGFSAGSEVDSSLAFAYLTNAGIVAKSLVEAIEADNGELIDCPELSASCVRPFYLDFAERAYRRPLLDEQVELIDSLYAIGSGDALLGIGNVVGFVLQSPSFLYYLDPTDDTSDYTLANRLAYLLWNEPPDQELLVLADQNELRNPIEFETQVDRLLADERGKRTLIDFVTQWLALERVQQIFKDANEIPGFSGDVITYLEQDLMNYVTTSLQQENSFEYLFNGSYQLSTELTSSLSAWGNDVQTTRRGIMSQPGVLAFLAGPTERSPIQRGAFVEDKLLCNEQEPADDIDDVVNNTVIPEDATPREKTLLLTSSPECQSCHESINTLGFGFEDYDGIGLPTAEGMLESFELHATATATGKTLSFNGIEQMQEALLGTGHFYDCGVEKALAYANIIDRPSETSAEAINSSFRNSADLKALFKSIALTMLENN